MKSEKESDSSVAMGKADAPWLKDPPKPPAEVAASPELEAELDRLEKGIAEEVKAEETSPAKIIVAGGLDEAKAYVAPMAPAAHPEHRTIEVDRVRIAATVDPRHAPTQQIDRAMALRAAALGGAEAGAGVGIGESTELLVARRRWPRGLVIALLLAACVIVAAAAFLRFGRSTESVTYPPMSLPPPSPSPSLPLSPEVTQRAPLGTLPTSITVAPPAPAATEVPSAPAGSSSSPPVLRPERPTKGGARPKSSAPPELFD